MRILITGANQPLGQAVAHHLHGPHQLVLTDVETELSLPLPSVTYHQADLRRMADVVPLVAQIEAILHLANFAPPPLSGDNAEQERLDLATRGTYILLQAARKAAVDRVILVSTLAHFEAYPADYIIDEAWQPQPAPNADSLAPYLSEITCREFAREGGIRCLCLRCGSPDEPDGTALATILKAMEGALSYTFEPLAYRWRLFHLSDNNRYNTKAADQALLTSGGE